MSDEMNYNKAPMSETEIEIVTREAKKLKLMFTIYAVLGVVFAGMAVYGIVYQIIMFIIMGGFSIFAYIIISFIFSFRYRKLKKDLDDRMMYSETGVLDDIYMSFGKGPKYPFTMNGKTRYGFREMHESLKKGDRVEVYFACVSKMPVGFKKLS